MKTKEMQLNELRKLIRNIVNEAAPAMPPVPTPEQKADAIAKQNALKAPVKPGVPPAPVQKPGVPPAPITAYNKSQSTSTIANKAANINNIAKLKQVFPTFIQGLGIKPGAYSTQTILSQLKPLIDGFNKQKQA